MHFHAGTAETIAEVFFHGERELPPGASRPVANLKLQDEVLVLPGDAHRTAVSPGSDDWREASCLDRCAGGRCCADTETRGVS